MIRDKCLSLPAASVTNERKIKPVLFSLRFILSIVASPVPKSCMYRYHLDPCSAVVRIFMDFSCGELLFPLVLKDIGFGRTCVFFFLC